MSVRDIFVIVFIVGSLPFCFFRPFYGILLWTVVSILNPQQYTWGLLYAPVSLAIAIPTLVGCLIFVHGWQNLFSKTEGLVVVLWLWFTFTTVACTRMPEFVHFADYTWYRWGFVSKIMVMALTTVGIVNTWERLRWLVLAIAGSFGVLVAKAVPFMIVTGGEFRLYGPPGTMMSDNNDMGLGLTMTLPIFYFLAQTEFDRRVKWLMGFLFVSTIPAILFTYSRGALLGLIAVLLMMVLRSRRRLILIPVLILGALFAVLFTPERWQYRMDFRREGALVDSSAMGRINAWTYSWRLALDYPLTGGGFEAFTPELFRRYAPDPRDVHGPHSIYFGVLAEHGFVGLGLYLFLIGSCIVGLSRAARYGRDMGIALPAGYGPMLQYSFVGFLVTGAFLGRAYFDYFFIILACSMVLGRLCKLDAAGLLAAEPAMEEQTA
jgi:probable O-glycosylation ligase (exosortase A-associated)